MADLKSVILLLQNRFYFEFVLLKNTWMNKEGRDDDDAGEKESSVRFISE